MTDLNRDARRLNRAFIVCVLPLWAACGAAPAAPGDGAAMPTETQMPAATGMTPASSSSGAAGSSGTPKTSSGTPATTPGKTQAAAAGSSATPSASAGATGATGAAASNKGDVTPAATAGSESKPSAGSGGSAAGSGATGAAGATATAGSGAAGSEGAPMMDLGKGDGTDVITIGDSWMQIATNGGGIEGALDRAMTRYRHYAVPGTQLLDGVIPGQYDQAKRANPKISTIIMTGGGNDVMFSGGCNTKEACTMFAQKIADGLDELWTKAVADGVTSTVYIQYSKNAGTAPADTRPDVAPIPKICTTGKLRCITIGTTDLIGPGDTVDGIHPTLAGCDRIAKRVIEEMEKAGARR